MARRRRPDVRRRRKALPTIHDGGDETGQGFGLHTIVVPFKCKHLCYEIALSVALQNPVPYPNRGLCQVPPYMMVRVSEALDLDRPDGYMQFADQVGLRARPAFEISGTNWNVPVSAAGMPPTGHGDDDPNGNGLIQMQTAALFDPGIVVSQ
jgi:hypothetical protein